MESLIAVLPTHVIDQIAAGEVIERPSSVVKELVDNAIDAGSQTISIETAAGGRALIRVVDDGRGMSPRDAVLAFERHATSKLRAVDDLWDLATMGFRGEALPSIASVARVVLTTRQQGDLAATRVHIEGGKLLSVSEVGAPVGTCVEVTDLLFNVPARLKFLKGETTEATHITDFVGKIAMAHPHLHVRLRHNGRVALDVPPDRDGFSRAQALLGSRIAARMIPVSGEESGIRVVAYLGAPELAQTTARGVQLFVGKRPVRDRGVLHAIAMGYGELVPRGRYPLAIILLDAPAGAVDFNVHPQKQEVRFADPGAVAAAVRHVVQAGISRAPWRDEMGGAGPVMMTAYANVAPPRLPLDAHATSLASTYASQLREQRERGHGRLDEARQLGLDESRQTGVDLDGPRQLGLDGARQLGLDGPRQWAQRIQERTRALRAAEAEVAARATQALSRLDADRLRDAAVPRVQRDANGHFARIDEAAWQQSLAQLAGDHASPRTLDRASQLGLDTTPRRTADAIPLDDLQLAEGSTPSSTPGFFSALTYLGQLDLTYLLCEGDGELVLIDQHIAHERVELSRLEARHAERGVATQRLLFPTMIEVEPAHVDVAARLADVLAQVGYETEPAGATMLAVKAVPGGIRHGDPTQLLRTLLRDWADDGAPTEAERLERVLAEIACHSVVRAGDRLSPSEAEALLRSMDGADFSTRGPHDRPVMLRLAIADIARRFGR